jgi:hypothetical protein
MICPQCDTKMTLPKLKAHKPHCWTWCVACKNYVYARKDGAEVGHFNDCPQPVVMPSTAKSMTGKEREEVTSEKREEVSVGLFQRCCDAYTSNIKYSPYFEGPPICSYDGVRAVIALAFRAGAEAEREECAKVADQFLGAHSVRIAEAIRARKDKP